MLNKVKNKTEFYNYNPEWETEAEKTIKLLKTIFGENAPDIRHIGGTAVKKIKSRPVIDIAVGLNSMNSIELFMGVLKTHGFFCDLNRSNTAKKIFYKYGERNKTHIVYVMLHQSKLWFDYLVFRDYMNISDGKAREYENLKLSVNGKYRSALPSYIKLKSDFIKKTVSDNFYAMMLGKNVAVKLDLENFNNYPKLNDAVYPLISGYIKNFEHKAYIIGVYDYNMPDEFNGKIIAYINNGGDKIFIAAKENMIFYEPEIYEAVKFMINGACNPEIKCLYEKSCGAVIYTKDRGEIKFLLVRGRASNRVGFPKGHIEKDENETETAIREIYEETSLNVVLYSDFKEEYGYTVNGYIKKTVVYFLAEFNVSDKYKFFDMEILEQRLVPYEKAYQMLTFSQDKTVLKKAFEKIK